MTKLEFVAENGNIRIDKYIADNEPSLTRTAAAKLIEQGKVFVNENSVGKNYKLKSGDRITLEIPDPVPYEAKPENIPLEIIYEDNDLLVVNKPKGMVVHPAAGNYDGTLVNALLYHCGDSLSGINGVMRPGIVHRIDKDTSGLLIVAKNDRKKMCVTEKNSKHAVTHYRVIARYKGYTHIKCILETGRTHQIRVHMAYIGHPVSGDLVYGVKNEKVDFTGQCLHARKIGFVHPRSGKYLEFTSQLPEYFRNYLEKLDKITK